jgi:hypothetical protein
MPGEMPEAAIALFCRVYMWDNISEIANKTLKGQIGHAAQAVYGK